MGSAGLSTDMMIQPMLPTADVAELGRGSVIVETPLRTIPEGSALIICPFVVTTGPRPTELLSRQC